MPSEIFIPGSQQVNPTCALWKGLSCIVATRFAVCVLECRNQRSRERRRVNSHAYLAAPLCRVYGFEEKENVMGSSLGRTSGLVQRIPRRVEVEAVE